MLIFPISNLQTLLVYIYFSSIYCIINTGLRFCILDLILSMGIKTLGVGEKTQAKIKCAALVVIQSW